MRWTLLRVALPLPHQLSTRFFSFAPDDALQKKGAAYARLLLSPPAAVFSMNRLYF
jgi:hypothetical protein